MLGEKSVTKFTKKSKVVAGRAAKKMKKKSN